MTVRQLVLVYLKASYPETTTNFEIAACLGLPEASVRRATLTLEKMKRIHFSETTSFGRIMWQANGW